MEKSAGLLSGHRHSRGRGGHSFSTTSAHPPVHQFPRQEQPPGSPAGSRCPAVQGGHRERVSNETSLGFDSRLFLVPKKTGDLRPVIDLATLNWHMVVPHFKMETQGSVKAAIRSQRHKRRLSPCPDAQGRKKISAFCGQQASLPVHLSPLRNWPLHLGSSQSYYDQ